MFSRNVKGMKMYFLQNTTTVGYIQLKVKVKVKWSRYRPGVAQRVGRGLAVLFHDRGTRSEWVVSSTLRPFLTPGKEPVPIVQEAGWTPGPVWTGGKSRPHRDSIPDLPARSQSLYWLSYPGPHWKHKVYWIIKGRCLSVQCECSHPYSVKGTAWLSSE